MFYRQLDNLSTDSINLSYLLNLQAIRFYIIIDNFNFNIFDTVLDNFNGNICKTLACYTNQLCSF